MNNYTVVKCEESPGYVWAVYDKNDNVVAHGHMLTVEGAERSARNFIKKNQNIVYKE